MNWIRAILVPSLAVAGLVLEPFEAGAADSGSPTLSPRENNVVASSGPHLSRRLEEDELCRLLTDFLNGGRGENGGEWELHITRPWTPVTVPEGPLKAEIIEPALNRIASSSTVRFELRAGRQLLGVWQVPVQARLWREVVIAETALRRGERLSAAALTLKRRDVLTLHDPLYELPSGATAYELAEGVPLGAPLTTRVVRLKPVVFRGKTVDAVVRDEALTISLKVEVLEDGVPGQLVRVRNLQSRRELRGKVQDEQTIAIVL